MTDQSSIWATALDLLAPFVPPTFGAFIWLRYSKEQTHGQRVTGFVISCGLSIYGTAVIAEQWHWGPAMISATSILLAIVGMDVVGGLLFLSAGIRTDPFGTIKRGWNVWRGRDA